MSEENFNYDDLKKVTDLWLEKYKQQQPQDFSDSAKVILDQQYSAFFDEYKKSLSQKDLHLIKEIVQQLQLLLILRQQNS
jgi:hypothetical protein